MIDDEYDDDYPTRDTMDNNDNENERVEAEGERLVSDESRKRPVLKDRSLFGLKRNYTLKEVVMNFFFCRGLQIRKIEGKLESPVVRLIYLIFVICMVIIQVFLRGWNLFTLIANSQKTNAGFWIFYVIYCILTVVTLVFIIMPLLIYELRMLFLGFSLCCTSLSCIFGIAEIIILAFVVTSADWEVIIITSVGNLCLFCWFWLPALYLGDLIRRLFTKPKRSRKRRRTLDDMYGD